MDKLKLESFYRLWQSQLDNFLAGYLNNENKVSNPKREIFFEYFDLITRFFKNKTGEIEKINLLSGIRGVGKTTLLAQLYDEAKKSAAKSGGQIYLDVSRLAVEKISLNDFFNFYEAIKGFHWETVDEKIIIFLDEAHYDPDWGLFLKNLFDRTKNHRNILVIATGSSALKIKLNPDLVRRSLIKEIYPLKFNEFLSLKENIAAPAGLSARLAESLIAETSTEAACRLIGREQKTVNSFFAGLRPNIEEEFLLSGGFPFILKVKENKQLVYELTLGVVEKLITKDILELRRFNSETIAKITDILYLIAVSDATDYEKLCTTVKMDYRSVRSVIEALIYGGILFEAKSYGEKFVKVRKPAKLLFVSPSLRVGLLKGVVPPEIKGKLLEDYSALLFCRHFKGEVFYDSAAGGADFVLRDEKKKEKVIEIGYGVKIHGVKQVLLTAKKLKNFTAGMVISEDAELKRVGEMVIKVPLKFWLMI